MKVFQWFRRKPGAAASIPWPRPDIDWQEPWHQVADTAGQLGLQRELTAEIGPRHPLWSTDPIVLGRHGGTDDVLVALSGGRYAIVHLVWHGHIDQDPSHYPATTLYADLESVKKALAAEAREWKDRHDDRPDDQNV